MCLSWSTWCFAGLQPKSLSRASCIVLLRHGEREDYMAEKAGKGADWIATATRPWDPPLAANGRLQAAAAATRLRQVLQGAGIPMPTQIFTSPLVRCVETADFVAKEFGVSSLQVENGLAESIYEAWMRQWAVPGANSKWGGPPGCAIPQERQGMDPRRLRGPEVPHPELRPEALSGPETLLSTAAELQKAGWSRVDGKSQSVVLLHDKGYCWDNFEIHEEVVERLVSVARRRALEHSGETVVLVSHGGPTTYALRALSHQKPKGEGGMTALSILRALPGDIESGRPWEVLLSNDASHGQAFAHGEETKICVSQSAMSDASSLFDRPKWELTPVQQITVAAHARELGNEQLRAGKHEEAFQLYKKALFLVEFDEDFQEDDEDDPRPLPPLQEVYAERERCLGNIAASALLLASASSEEERKREEGFAGKAKRYSDRALRLNAGSAKLWFRKGRAEMMMTDFAAALKSLTEAVRLAPADPEVRKYWEEAKSACKLAEGSHRAAVKAMGSSALWQDAQVDRRSEAKPQKGYESEQ
ncbi:FKBP62, partial [Symbiodinium sp. CCMP2456]